MIQESIEAAQALGDGELGLDDATSVVGLGMAALNAFLDPAGALVGAALGPLLDWVAANVSFVKEPLDLLLGDPPEIMGYAGSWGQASQQLAQVAQQHAQAVAEQISGWTGPARDAYLQVQANVAKALISSAKLAQTMAQAVQVAGTIVAVLRELIWGMVKDLVISLVTNAVIAAASAIPSLGSSLAAYTAWASAKVSLVMGKISMGISKVFGKLSKLTSKIGPLSRMFAKAAAAFEKMGAKFFKAAGRMPDGTKIPDATAGDLPGTSAAGMGPEGGSPGGPDAPSPGPEAPRTPDAASTPPDGPGGPPLGERSGSPDEPKGPLPSPPFGEPQQIDPTKPVGPDSGVDLKPKNDHATDLGVEPGEVPDLGWDPDDPAFRATVDDATKKGWPDPTSELANFSTPPEPVTIKAGTPIHRVAGDGTFPSASYFMETPPTSMTDFRSTYAVPQKWNGNGGIITHTPVEDIKAWRGGVAPQPSTQSTVELPSHYPGGGTQIWTTHDAIGDKNVASPNWWLQGTGWTEGK